LYAQKTSSEYKVKAVFLYNFTRFIDWPPSAFSSPESPFIIGIIGDDPFGSYLEEAVSGEQIENHTIIIKRYHSISEIKDCQVLYINSSNSEYIKEIISLVGKRSILTVSDANNFARWGGMIRLFTDDEKIRIQINSNAAKASQLNISSKLLSVAEVF
jgi:hypothetical protein